jgi:hypothetical protein
MAWKGPWVTATYYYANELVSNPLAAHGLFTYICILAHTSSAAGAAGDEPGVGANTATYWAVYSGGGEDGVGVGDVVGPAAAIDSNFVAFNTTTGKLVKDSLVNAATFATAAAMAALKIDTIGAPTAVTTHNVGTVHGFCPALPTTTPTTAFLSGSGSWCWFVDNESPSGAINGINKAFVLAFTPIAGSLHFVVDGAEIYSTGDYTLATKTVTTVGTIQTGSVVKATYRHNGT